MPEIDRNKTVVNGILGLLLVLSGFGGNVLLSEDEFANTYVCSLNENVGIFHRLSTSGKTAYYYNEEDIEKSVSCRSGMTYTPWISLEQYAIDNGVDPLTFIISKIEVDQGDLPSPDDLPLPTKGMKWKCSVPPIGCVEIND